MPVPPQRGQATLNFIPPPDCVMWPLPWHCGQVVRRSHYTATVAVGTGIKARDVQAHYRAADRVPEADIDLVFQIGTAFWPDFRGCAATPTAKDT